MKVRIYHNPRCSKSRQALSLLEEKNSDVEIIMYLKTPPSKAELQTILDKLGLSPMGLMRKGESVFKELQLGDKTDAVLLDAMVKHPILIERPIVLANGKARIGRPPESILEIV